jgi:hypothetical protein
LWAAICLISGSSLSPAHCWPFCLSGLCLQKVHTEIGSLLLPSSMVQRLVGCLPFQGLFTESSCGDQLLLLPTSLVHSEHTAPPLPIPFQFLAYYSVCLFCFVFCRAGVSLSRGLYLFIPGVAVGIPRATYLLTCWPVSPKQV